MRKNILEIRNFSGYFKTSETLKQVVHEVNLDIRKGETLGIVGESGSGKSVTALSMLRLNPPSLVTEGSMLFFNEEQNKYINLLTISEKEIKTYRGSKIAMIFQDPMTSLNPVYTCGDQIAEAIELHKNTKGKTSKKLAVELFDEVKLPNPEIIYNKYPHELSGGQKQRVMIAMAISCNPDILIADEPTTALDPTVQKSIFKLLKNLKSERGMSMIIISHDLGVIAENCDNIIIMYRGKIMEKGEAKKIFSCPENSYTKGLLACRPSTNYDKKRLPTVEDFINPKKDKDIFSDNDVSENPYSRKENIYKKNPLLRVQNLQTLFSVKSGVFGTTKNYIKAVNSVSFELYPGETLGLVGESGCGKTTLGRSILRLIEPSSGRILFNNTEITSVNRKQMRLLRKDMQLIFQDPYSSLDPRQTVGSAICEPMKVHKIHNTKEKRKDAAVNLLKQVNMNPDDYYKYPSQFSGGQRQRICIARALAINPKLIVCDESVSALDVSVQAQVINLLIDLRKDIDLSYIFISHDLAAVRFISDRIIVMNKGQIEEINTPEEIFNNPTSDYTKKLIDAIPAVNR